MNRHGKLAVAVLISAFLFQFVSSQAKSFAAQPTSKCKKAGQIQTINSKRFTCVVKSGRLSWILAPPILVKPLVSPKPVENSPNIDPLVDKVNHSLNNILDSIALPEVSDSETGIIVAEANLDSGNIVEAKKILRQISFAQPIFKLKEPPVVILATSIQFIKAEYSKYCSDNLDWFPNNSTTMDKWQNWAFVGCLNSRPVQVVPLPTTGIPISHIESAIGSDLGYLPIGLGLNTKKLPTWFVRGLKGVVGEYAMSLGKKTWQVNPSGVRSCLNVKLSEISYSFEDVTSNYCDTVLGTAASRYVVSLKGLVSTLEFINKLQATGVWSEQIFADFLGIPFIEFEANVKTYVKSLN